MHRLSQMGLALLGLSLVAPNTSRAGDPTALTYDAHARSYRAAGSTHRPRHLCPACQERLRQGDPSVARIPEQVPVMPAVVDCTACQPTHGTGPILVGDGSGYTVVANPTLGPTTASGYNPPGHAIFGAPMSVPGPGTMTSYPPPGSPWPGSPMMTGNNTPGYAVVGGMNLTAEPTPIGVVQTNFRSAGGMPSPGPAAASPLNPSAPPNSPALGAPGVFPGHRRPHVLAHLFGLSGRNRWAEAWRAQQRANHAAISYGPTGQPPSELPASMVYGR